MRSVLLLSILILVLLTNCCVDGGLISILRAIIGGRSKIEDKDKKSHVIEEYEFASPTEVGEDEIEFDQNVYKESEL